MGNLAKFFVSLVTLANTVAPQANIPKVLGVNVSQDTYSLETSEVATDTATSTDATVTSVKDAVEETRAKRIEAVQQFRANRQDAIEQIQQIRAEFRERLSEIKDERKRRIVELIDLRLEKMNERWVNHWNNVLERLSILLAKLGTRADKAEARGYDMSGVRTAIASAESAISTAQTAVNEQAGRVYTIEITDESSLGQNVRDAIQELRSDLRAVRELVSQAREAVVDALKSFKIAAGLDAEGE